MKTAEIRRRFIDYFVKHSHKELPAGSLVPANDPSLLFTNAGMVQFKDVFLGTDIRNYSRAVTSQRCVRAGGKHNDLENVGYTARHHTFFEMLGNFSFGDYFKREVIVFAWTFLTEELGLPANKLWVTVYKDDDEAADIWINEVGVDPSRLSRLGDKDNFWMMGDTGPCGPSSEIFYDHGEDVPGGPPGSEDDDLDRYIEIWNLVFMQFDTLPSGERVPLPKPSVDTGMGLERLAAVLQNVHSNYEIDLFQALISAAMKATGCDDVENRSLRVIADHIRSAAFLIVDDVVPSNEGRGYVLRRIIRRAIRHGYQMGCKDLFFYRLVEALDEQMGEAYPELTSKRSHIEKVLKLEEDQFARTLEKGMALLEASIESGDASVISGEVAFKLYDTYGFPLDLTADVAREKGLALDEAGFEAAMAEQRQRAKAASKFSYDKDADFGFEGETQFIGYSGLTGSSKVQYIIKDGTQVESLSASESGVLVLDKSPFYGESGGQCGDTGTLANDHVVMDVTDCTKLKGVHLHHVNVQTGTVSVGSLLNADVVRHKRDNTAKHHSATHLLHAALRSELGEGVTQKGSSVTPDRLRFDFVNLEPVSFDQLKIIEQSVNAQIRANTPVITELMTMEEAQASGAMALFGEKYDDEVRVLSMGTDEFSKELCGGTHVARTGDIGLFKILSETGVAAGVRRIEAVVGEAAIAASQQQELLLLNMQSLLNGRVEQLPEKISQLIGQAKQYEKELSRLKDKLASSAAGDLTSKVQVVNGVSVLAEKLEGGDAKSLRTTVDQLKSKLGSGVIVLAVEVEGKAQLAVGITKDLTSSMKAGDLIKEIGPLMGAKGGGKPDMAMAGGGDLSKLAQAFAVVGPWVQEKVGG